MFMQRRSLPFSFQDVIGIGVILVTGHHAIQLNTTVTREQYAEAKRNVRGKLKLEKELIRDCAQLVFWYTIKLRVQATDKT